MTNQELQQLVEQISRVFFHRPFRHRAIFNTRLRTTGGRYHLNDHHLDFNPQVYKMYGEGELINVIKHELCHYHLHLTGKGYQHRDADFKRLLAETGGSRYVRSLTGKAETRWAYHCASCGSRYLRKRQINTVKFVCGKCRGKLILEGRVVQ